MHNNLAKFRTLFSYQLWNMTYSVIKCCVDDLLRKCMMLHYRILSINWFDAYWNCKASHHTDVLNHHITIENPYFDSSVKCVEPISQIAQTCSLNHISHFLACQTKENRIYGLTIQQNCYANKRYCERSNVVYVVWRLTLSNMCQIIKFSLSIEISFMCRWWCCNVVHNDRDQHAVFHWINIREMLKRHVSKKKWPNKKRNEFNDLNQKKKLAGNCIELKCKVHDGFMLTKCCTYL